MARFSIKAHVDTSHDLGPEPYCHADLRLFDLFPGNTGRLLRELAQRENAADPGAFRMEGHLHANHHSLKIHASVGLKKAA